jgi:hypothetical protein
MRRESIDPILHPRFRTPALAIHGTLAGAGPPFRVLLESKVRAPQGVSDLEIADG